MQRKKEWKFSADALFVCDNASVLDAVNRGTMENNPCRIKV
jgi:hypothetical protein